MTRKYTGQCACGTVRIEAVGEPVAELHCQCRHCQLRSGTGHSSFLVFDKPGTVKIDGETRNWTVVADSGNEKHQAFCPDCGTPTHVTFAASPDVTAISPSLLDRPGQFMPKLVTYASSAVPWDAQEPLLARFDKLPTS
ncbi:MAG: GFA family protein [Rhizobiaceae bacterium]|nr:GFA family protein [Rhizobiaceae bacterium]